MRDPDRIEPFLAALAEHWKKVPDQRFGQMVMNLCRDNIGQIRDPWEWEENTWLEKIGKHQPQHHPRNESATPDEATLAALRRALLALMSDWSEGTYAAGWMSGLEEMLHEQAGIWEIIGRNIGWPTGYEHDKNFRWVTWDEAAELFAKRDHDRRAARG